MIHSITVFSIVASVAFAQQSFIPSDISSGCTDLLNSINGDSSLSSCLNAMNSATSSFAPGSSSQKSSSDISTALAALCTENTACSASAVRTYLAKFPSQCQSELSGNSNVSTIYDILYALIPLRGAVCAKDTDGSWCVQSNAKNIGDSSKSLVDNYLVVQNQNRDIVNTTTFCSSNLAFGCIDPSLSSDKLCTTCTAQIVSSYINFESNTPYALGVVNSELLCGQNKLYDAVTSTCPNLLGGAVQAAGGISAGLGSGNNAASSSFDSSMEVVVGAVLGVASLAFL